MTEEIRDLDPSLNHVPGQVSTIHIMGICGTAMAALAGMLKEQGYSVTGSDLQVYPPMSDFLKQIGIHPYSGYQAKNLQHKPDLVIVGNVITRVNPEAQALAESSIPYISMPQALEHFFISTRRSLVITGTHGKTTTSSMLASALHHLGADPTFMIGGILHAFKSNYRIGAGPFFVAEGDEYDTAFFDKVSKFLHYRPEIAVITSLEFDHADIFQDLEAIKNSFRKFVSLMPADGLLIANTDDENVLQVIDNAPCPVQSYGTGDSCNWRLEAPRHCSGNTRFPLLYRDRMYNEITITYTGIHNCMNATAVIAILHHLGFSRVDSAAALHDFNGVKRRQEIKGVVDDITVIDDFAHHPTAVRETLKALRQAYPHNRLIAVFEPRTNTSRRSFFQQEYISSFLSADLSLVREP
ncbi:MAG: UDP-N-acetylmuramate:L-alanyl-gamma-D-glutamyl-meso-diaminopimelate ligase, partial [Desulfocapsaceae bacterium]|nr:UDP-N-acetylmuramate:L-alanyl-gamma-D-glutamyl-meso-diaminopimelate ligase [Desulfocapsaceae bacterium]